MRLLGGRASQLQQRAAEHHTGQQRAGAEVAAELLEHRAQALAAEIQAALFLGERNGAPAQLDHFAPQGAVEAERRLVVAQAPLRSHRAACGEKLAGGIGQQALFFAIYQAHCALLTLHPAGRAHAWR
ncbi:hypothetical protein D3C80_1798920 [compost metagenome]